MKTKILPIITILLLVFTSINVIGIGSEDDGKLKICVEDETINFSQATIETKDNYLSVNVEEANTFLKETGKPILPVYTKTFTFPSGTIIKNVEFTSSEVISEVIDGKIQPSPRPMPRTSLKNTVNNKEETADGEQIVKENEIIEDESVYLSSNLYPNSWHDYKIRHGFDNGEDVIFVNVNYYPVRYSPVENTLYYTNNVDINIIYEEVSKPFASENEYDLLIISPKEFTIDLLSLKIHKTLMGVSTIIKTVESIYEEYDGIGRDKPEQIKYFIKDAKEDWGIKYLLLVGGLKSLLNANDRDNCNEGSTDWYLPVRYANICYGDEPGIISDLYYADIYKINDTTQEKEFEDWDPNGDGIFASWYMPDVEDDGNLDLEPDVYYGRLACRNKAEVRTIVRKIIQYERPTLLSKIIGKPWMEKMIAVGGNTFGFYEGLGENGEWDGEYLCNLSLDYMMDAGLVTKPVKILSTNNNTGGPVPVAGDIIKEFSKGAGFVLFQGHGAPWIWDTNWADYSYTWTGGLPIYFMPLLRNGKKLPIVVVGGCHNALFNVTLIQTMIDIGGQKYWTHGMPASECFSWKLCSKPRGGAISSTGCTGFGLGYPGNPLSLSAELECNFFHTIANFDDNDDKTLGEAHSGSIIKYINDQSGIRYDDAYVITQYQLFGDPSLRIGGYPPS